MEHLNPLEDPTGGLFVNREYELNLFWTWATSVPKIAQNSFARGGLRRTGKTAILHQLFNRLGYPYSIRSLMNSPSPARHRYPDLSALGEVFLFELTHQDGQLWNHYQEEFGKVVQQLNKTPTTQQVMLWATKYPNQQIDVELMAKELDKPEEEIRAALEKLHWVDVVRKSGLISYSGPNDPMFCGVLWRSSTSARSKS